MNLRTSICLLFTTLFLTVLNAQSYYPADYFQSPMDTPLYLSAPFGSLRDNHFHSGMDIRTYEKEGFPVYAVADGYVARIKVSSVGYGKAIYIDHPNGYTSVYGHLQRYEGPIADYIKQYQYEIKSFEFNHFPGRDKIRVKKGQIIGYSGNTGGSTGPHLHFEIRDTKSEEPINPQIFGIAARDSFPPLIKKLVCYNLDSQWPQWVQSIDLNRLKMVYTDSGYIYPDTLILPTGTMGFAIDAVDFLMNAEKEYSVYGLDCSIDHKKYFSFRLDRFHFDDSRCINVHIDYPVYKTEGIRYQKLFLDDGNRIPLYPYLRNKGKYLLKNDSAHVLKLSACDFSGQSFTCFVYMKGDPKQNVKMTTPTCNNAWMYPRKNNVFRTEKFIVQIPSGALYDTLPLCTEVMAREKHAFSSTIKVNDYTIPLDQNMSISIKPDEPVKSDWQKKVLLAYYSKSNVPRSAGGDWDNGYVTTRTTQFGNFFITIDTLAPVIKVLNIEKNNVVTDTASLKIRVTDNFAGIGNYQVKVNGKWVLAEYDAKNDLLEYFFDNNTPVNTPFKVEISVCDRKDNCTSVTRDVIRSK